MAKSTLMRVSIDRADEVKGRAATHRRQQVTELDGVIDTGLAVLDAISDGRLADDFLTKLEAKRGKAKASAKASTGG